jgi:hypothetical protein
LAVGSKIDHFSSISLTVISKPWYDINLFLLSSVLNMKNGVEVDTNASQIQTWGG